MTAINAYKSYNFRTKDPAIDKIRTAIMASNPGKNDLKACLKTLSDDSGVSRATFDGWFFGKTRRPQFATLGAAAGALGYDWTLTKKKPKA